MDLRTAPASNRRCPRYDDATVVDVTVDESTVTAEWTRRRFRAPRTHGSLLAAPTLASAASAAAQNRLHLDTADIVIGGHGLKQLRQQARTECLAAARGFAKEFGLSCLEVGDGPWFVTGHQPQLYHPGVWVKNFASAKLACDAGGVGLNLIVDNDVVTTFNVRVPAGDRESPVPLLIPFDVARSMQTWETASVQDTELFNSFAERVQSALRPWKIDPVVDEFWPLVQQATKTCNHLAKVLSAGRGALERRWGAGNWELPMSRMCQTKSFSIFVCDLLAELPRFHQLHNTILDEYRRINNVRSRTHPVPDLRSTSAGLEAPFWVWAAGDTRRGRLFARRESDRIVLSQESTPLADLPISDDPAQMLEAMSRLTANGLQLRPRALTTTLYSRLLLADLFIHGIGGAKYDETTDQLLQRFYNIRPPEFMTLTATLHLPLEAHAATAADQHRVERQLRDVRYHPLEAAPRIRQMADAAPLVTERDRWIAEQQAVSTARREHHNGVVSAGVERFTRLHQLTANLAERAGPLRADLQVELADTLRKLRANRLLQDREYAFCLFPESTLREAMQRWCS